MIEKYQEPLQAVEAARHDLRSALRLVLDVEANPQLDEANFRLLMDRKQLLMELIEDLFSAVSNRWNAENNNVDIHNRAKLPRVFDLPGGTSDSEKTPHDFGLDCLLLLALKNAPINKPIGLKTIHNLAHAYDPRRRAASITTKMSRWRTEGLVTWRDSNDRKLTEAGRAHLDSIQHFLNEDSIARIKSAFQSILGFTVGI